MFLQKMKSTFMISHFFIASCSRLTKLPFSTRSVPKVLVPLANGSEELEAVTIIDILVRGGVEVTVASVHESLEIACSRGVKLLASRHIKACCDFDWDLIVIPGGMPGASNLQKSSILKTILHKHNGENKLIGAICASPAIVLSEFGLLENKKATCYPSPKFIEKLPLFSDNHVVINGNIITSQGPATSLQFALKLVELLCGREKSLTVARDLLYTGLF